MSDFKIRSQFLVKCRQCNFVSSEAELFAAIEVAQAHLEAYEDTVHYELKSDGHELEITEKKIVRRGY